MVPRGYHRSRVIENPPQSTAWLDLNVVKSRTPGRYTMGEAIANLLWKMRNKSASKGDVEHLHASANTETGDSASQDMASKVHLTAVATTVDHVHRVVLGDTVVFWIQVASSGQDQPVQSIKHRAHIRRRRKQHGGTTSAHDGIGIVGWQRVVPTSSRVPTIGGQSNDGCHLLDTHPRSK
jgi:hypothetical protein